MKTRAMILCSLFAALTAVGAFFRIPLPHITLTLQFFFTALAGILLGERLGALSQAVYVLLGLLGLPIFAGGGGFGYLLYPTFGFVLGLIPTAWLIGRLSCGRRTVGHCILSCTAGLAALYAVGLPYLALIVNAYRGGSIGVWTLAVAYLLPYLPGDIAKIALCACLAVRLPHRIFPERQR